AAAFSRLGRRRRQGGRDGSDIPRLDAASVRRRGSRKCETHTRGICTACAEAFQIWGHIARDDGRECPPVKNDIPARAAVPFSRPVQWAEEVRKEYETH